MVLMIFRKVGSGRAHARWPMFESGADGRGEQPLSEPVPNYFFRPDDYWVEGGNNTLIIFGRDRTGRGEVDSSQDDEGENKKNSLGKGSYGDYMAAGSIDIVAGRGAPFPMQIRNHSMGPLYQTKQDIAELKKTKLLVTEGEGITQPVEVPHPGYAMDASRILVSQMTRVDKNFGIKTNILQKGQSLRPKNLDKLPFSAIMIKSDQVRLHAREEIKIVTGGEEEIRNSQGEPIMVKGGIHLMAQNQEKSQQPIPLGNHLVDLMTEICDQLDKAYTEIIRLTKEQITFNRKIANHVHRSPMYGIPTTWDPELGVMGTITLSKQFKYVLTQAAKEKNNITSIRTKYLTQGDKGSGENKYINSVFNTTN